MSKQILKVVDKILVKHNFEFDVSSKSFFLNTKYGLRLFRVQFDKQKHVRNMVIGIRFDKSQRIFSKYVDLFEFERTRATCRFFIENSPFLGGPVTEKVAQFKDNFEDYFVDEILPNYGIFEKDCKVIEYFDDNDRYPFSPNYFMESVCYAAFYSKGNYLRYRKRLVDYVESSKDGMSSMIYPKFECFLKEVDFVYNK